MGYPLYRSSALNASTLSPLIWARNFARVCCGGWKRHRLCSLDRRYIDFTGYIKHLGFFQSNRRYGTRARSALFTRSQLNTVGGLTSMVSTWRMIRSAVSVPALAISVELAHLYWCRRIFHRIRCAYVCAVTTGHLTAHLPSHACA